MERIQVLRHCISSCRLTSADCQEASGAPISSATFGLGAEWTGRASELNLQRIDLRDFLCTVIIENSVHAPNFYSGVALKTSFSLPDFGLPAGSTTTYLFDTLEVATFNLADVSFPKT